jgi:hypothetical protein
MIATPVRCLTIRKPNSPPVLRMSSEPSSLSQLRQAVVLPYPNPSRHQAKSLKDIYSDLFHITFSSSNQLVLRRRRASPRGKQLSVSLHQPFPLPLVHHSLAIILALPLCSICRIEQVVCVTSHTAPACRRCRINPLEWESSTWQLPSSLVIVGVVITAKARAVAGSTACGRFV